LVTIRLRGAPVDVFGSIFHTIPIPVLDATAAREVFLEIGFAPVHQRRFKARAHGFIHAIRVFTGRVGVNNL